MSHLSQGKGWGGEHGDADPGEEGLWKNPKCSVMAERMTLASVAFSDKPDAERPRPAAMSLGTPEVLGLGRVGGREDFSWGGLDSVWALLVRFSIKLGRNV